LSTICPCSAPAGGSRPIPSNPQSGRRRPGTPGLLLRRTHRPGRRAGKGAPKGRQRGAATRCATGATRPARPPLKPRKEGTARVTTFSPDYLAARFCIRQTAASGSCSLPLDQYLPSPRPSGGSLVIIGPGTGYQGQWLLWGPRCGGAGSRAPMAAHASRPGGRAARHVPPLALQRGRSYGRAACW
jgi:hypothetical protein